MLTLSLNTRPQAQLEALQDLPDHRSGSSWVQALLALLDLSDSVRFDPSGRLVCSLGPCQLSCCRGVVKNMLHDIKINLSIVFNNI